MSPELRKLQDLLEKHDWYYAMSDDHRVYNKGVQEWASIKSMVDLLGYDGRRLLNAYLDIKNNPASGFSWVKHPEPQGNRLEYIPESSTWSFPE